MTDEVANTKMNNSLLATGINNVLSAWKLAYTSWKCLYLTNRLFIYLGVIALCAALTYIVPVLFFLPVLALIGLLGITAFDVWQLFNGQLKIAAYRILPKVFSLGDESFVKIKLANISKQPLTFRLVDELPIQLQKRDMSIVTQLRSAQRKALSYPIKPMERGAYNFGKTNVFVSSRIGLIERRFILGEEVEIPTYPSIVQMNHFANLADVSVVEAGSRRMPRLGKSYEFDQIKNYVRGDDYRLINWRATAKKNELMVNKYEEEKAQNIYCIIDKSRNMHMPFNGLTLLDHAINASLALSNVVLRKHDRAGLITFSDKIGSALKADAKPTQLRKILQALYLEEARTVESNPKLLYYASRKFISHRSLLMLFVNFNSNYALERMLPVLRKLNRHHLLVVVLFINTEIQEEVIREVNTVEDIYLQSTARKFMYEKKMLAQQLRQYGIQVILTKPADLTGEVINKYLELKQRAMI